MEKLLYFFIHLGLRARTRLGHWLNYLLVALLLIFIFLWGQWPLVGIFYFRYIVLLFIIITLFLGMRRYDSMKPFMTWRPVYIVRLFVVLGLIYGIGVLDFNLVIGRSTKIEQVPLEFPLRMPLSIIITVVCQQVNSLL
jgi:hypothetical protein